MDIIDPGNKWPESLQTGNDMDQAKSSDGNLT
jgi:hypothetical protein